MSIISNALDQTKNHHKKNPSNAAYGYGRVDTDGDDPDLSALDKLITERTVPDNMDLRPGDSKQGNTNQK